MVCVFDWLLEVGWVVCLFCFVDLWILALLACGLLFD